MAKKIAFCFYETEFAWCLQYGHEIESCLYKGKEKSPWPAYALGELHKVAFADSVDLSISRQTASNNR